jgi:hypothetical protein
MLHNVPSPRGERVRVRGDFQMKLKSFSFVPSVVPPLNPGFSRSSYLYLLSEMREAVA